MPCQSNKITNPDLLQARTLPSERQKRKDHKHMANSRVVFHWHGNDKDCDCEDRWSQGVQPPCPNVSTNRKHSQPTQNEKRQRRFKHYPCKKEVPPPSWSDITE